MTLYTYEKNINLGNNKIHCLMGVKENVISNILEKFSYILEWFSVGILFYLNSAFIHSRLFSLFIFILGLALMMTLKFERKLSSKEEFLKKVNEILKEQQNDR